MPHIIETYRQELTHTVAASERLYGPMPAHIFLAPPAKITLSECLHNMDYIEKEALFLQPDLSSLQKYEDWLNGN